MNDWLSKKNPYLLPTVVAFLYAFYFSIGKGWGSISGIFHEIFSMLFLSGFSITLFFLFFMTGIEDENTLNVAGLLWAVIAAMGAVGGFWMVSPYGGY